MEPIPRRTLTRRELLAAGTAVVAAGVLACSKTTSTTDASLALRNARLFSAIDDSVFDGATVAIKDDRIIAVGKDSDVRLARGVRSIDCAGAFVMPGLIDSHTHVTITLVKREPLFGQWLRAGLLTVRDCGTLKQGPGLIRQIARELAPTPRIVAAGPILTVPGGYPITRGPAIGEPIALPISSAADAAAAVNQVVDDGADFIKIAVETGYPGGHLHEEGHARTLDVPEIRAIVTAAHRRGVKVSAHLTNFWELQSALDGGVDVIAHTPLDPIPSALLQTMLDRGLPMVSTLNIWGSGAVTETAMRNVAAYARRGGAVAMGTDYPFQAFEGLPMDELGMLQRAGLAPVQVLLAATRNAAAVCGLTDVGVIGVGKIADVIVVQGDPTTELSALRHVSSVIQSGREVL